MTSDLLRKVASMIENEEYEVFEKVANDTKSDFEKSDLAKFVGFIIAGEDNEEI